MAKSTPPDTRQQRLAAKLKENLRRRKAQSRARKSQDTGKTGAAQAQDTDSAGEQGER